MEVAVVLALAAAGLIGVVAHWFGSLPKSGADYVYVEHDGSVRDLAAEEIEYLDTDFLPNDGNRPYVKSRYSERTPDGGLGGYLPRRKVPRRLRNSR